MIEPVNSLERSFGNFPAEHEHSTIEGMGHHPDNPELDVFVAAAEKLVNHWDGTKFVGLYLYGVPGTGKTHAAIGLARALHEEGASIHYRHIPSWKPNERRIDKGYSQSWETIEPHITDWMGYDSTSYISRLPFPTSRSGSSLDKGPEKMHDRSVLVLDDYKPFARQYVATAIEAASEYGGLVIVTSNYTDPFKILEETPQEQTTNAMLEVVTEHAPGIGKIAQIVSTEIASKRDSLRSRVAANFKFINFTGEDQRIEHSFWND